MSKPEPIYKIDLSGGIISQHDETLYVTLPPGYKIRVLCAGKNRLAVYPMIPRGQSVAQEVWIDQEPYESSPRALESIARSDGRRRALKTILAELFAYFFRRTPKRLS
jgi:hypothetical protein